jgi:hypothetical protein
VLVLGLLVGFLVAWRRPRCRSVLLGRLNPEFCPRCGGRMELIAFIAEAGVAKRILDHLGLPSSGPPPSRPRAPAETFDPDPEHDGADSSWDE